ncbi:MAG: 6-phosphofructokinase [Ilumatobacteraceae bacterium]
MRIALSTGGGDAPGLNAVIRAATFAARRRGWDVVGIRDGFNGILFPDQYPDGQGMFPLDARNVRGIGHLGGTMLGSTNRGNPCRFPVVQPDGTVTYVDRTVELVGRFREEGIDALISIGGDGSLSIAQRLYEEGLRVIGVPKTIDNDLDHTLMTFGFTTAVEIATESIDRLFTTAASHSRVFVVEVMGRDAGWIALYAGVASGAHVILIPEIPFSYESVARAITRRERNGAHYTIVVVAEGAAPIGGHTEIIDRPADHAERLGGIGHVVAENLTRLTGKEARTVVLGHLVRGGTPTATDRLLGSRFGAAAVRALDEGQNGVMVALNEPVVEYVTLAEAVGKLRVVPMDCDTLLAGRELGTSFGDEPPGPEDGEDGEDGAD